MALLTAVTIFALLFNLLVPLIDFTALAQEATEEAATPTDEATSTPVAEQTAEPPPAEPTVVATLETTPEATAEPTALPTDAPTEPPLPTPTPPLTETLFQDDFQDANTEGWALTPGWGINVEGENLFLSAATPNENATIANLTTSDFVFSARVRIADGNKANILFRALTENYTLTLDTLGNASLFRNGVPVAQGPAAVLPEGAVGPLWHTVNITAQGGTISVTVNGVPQIVFSDPAPLAAGMISITTDAANTGMVSIDQVLVSQVVATVEPPVVVIPTETPTAEPEVTTEPEAETTSEPEATEVAIANPGVLVLSATFDGELAGWLMSEGASVVLENETNSALLMAGGSTLLPAEALYLADFRLDARLNILSDVGDGSPTGVSFAFRTQEGRGYVLSVEAGQTALYRNDGAGLTLLTSSPTPHALNTWHTLRLDAQGGHLTVAVDGLAEIDFTDAEPLTNGQIAFIANPGSSVMLDDISLTDFSTLLALTTTPAPFALTEAERAKLPEPLASLVELYVAGDNASTAETIAANFLPVDDEGRLYVVVWAAEGQTGQAVAALVETVGGVINATSDYSVEARLPLASFLPLLNAPEVGAFRVASVVTSTGNAAAPADFPGTGQAISDGYDVLGANDWNGPTNNLYTGAGTSITVIDTGFVGVVDNTEWSCIVAAAPAGGDNHGNRVVQILCDIAPGASVRMLRATTAAEVATAINTARVTHNANIILIPLDLGAHVAPGDGSDGGASGTTVYDQIASARSEGRLVVVSAGNNFGRYASFTYGGGTTNLTITDAKAGDKVNVSWNDWNSNPNGGATREDLTMTLTNATAGYTGRPVNGNPSHQFTFASDCTPTCTLTINSVTGDAANVYIQVQLTGTGTLGTPTGGGISGTNTTSSIGRPADSPNALAVGAVCFYQENLYPLMSDSSRGPIFSAGGNTPGSANSARSNFKPDLVGPSDVSTSFDVDLSVPGSPITGVQSPCSENDGEGFEGTSAAAAHVAAMAALIRSNTNVSATTPAAITDYMQSHSIDLPILAPDGFDFSYGSGLAVLGDPTPSGPLAVDPATLADVTCTGGGAATYVSPFNLSAERNLSTLGTRTNPFIHPAHAINEAGANGCVVLLPGEYVTGFSVENANVSTGVHLQAYQLYAPTAAESVFWANNSVSGGAVALRNLTNAFSVEGFLFNSANPLGGRFDVSTGGTYPPNFFPDPAAITVVTASNSVISDNEITGFAFGTPAMLLDDTNAVTVSGNIFSGNIADAGAAMRIQNSGGTSPVVVSSNTFTGHTSVTTGFVFQPVIQIINGEVNILNNRFTGNNTGSQILVNNTNDPAYNPVPPAGYYNSAQEVNVVGNAFFSNTNSGPIVHLDPGRRFRFVNNTVAANTGMGSFFIIHRGIASSGTSGGGRVELHNNLLYNNGTQALFSDEAIQDSCANFADQADSGARFNISFGSGGAGGDCVNSLGNAAFNNLFSYDPTNDFIGATVAPNDPYQPKAGTMPIDYGNTTFLAGLITQDVLGKPRIDGASVDAGAYEFKAVSAIDINVATEEDTPSLDIVMNDYIIGGFPPYTVDILDYPNNYSTNPNNVCGGLPFKQTIVPATQQTILTYCPPPDFYNNGGGLPAAAGVQFEFQIRDNQGAVSTPTNNGTITVNKATTGPNKDLPLATPVTGYTVITAADTQLRFRLRPYVRFDNFRLSESTNEAEYPYTYGSVAIDTVIGDNQFLFDTSGNSSSLDEIQAAITAAGSFGEVVLTPKAGEVGFLDVTYTATDDPALDGASDQSVGNRVRLLVTGILPDNGLHDDTSFAFNYRGTNPGDSGSWTPAYSEPAINNTLHTTLVKNDTAEFLFTGGGFALYMQGSTAGSWWELQIDTGGTVTRFPWNGQKVVTSNGITCRTSAVTGTNTSLLPEGQYYISNRTVASYVVSCEGLLEDEAHSILIINRDIRILYVDAVGIVEDSSPLLRGIHEVTESQLRPLFFDSWVDLIDVRAGGQRAKVLTNPNAANVQFSFKGTGFALGTTLERTITGAGAEYEICVAPETAPANQMCQTFNNGNGATTVPLWNVFRPFFGFDPTIEHHVTIDIINITAPARFVIDSIIVYDTTPTATMDMGTTEDDDVGKFVFGGGMPDNWALNTYFPRASNSSLTTMTAITKAGPFVAFRVADATDTINWTRYAYTTDSQQTYVCVDRGQGDTAGDETSHCVLYNLRTSGNPIVIRESDFNGGAGWGSAWPGGYHTVEIFSVINQWFNVDRIQAVTSDAPLTAGYYEENVPNVRYFSEDSGTYTLAPVGDDANFTEVIRTTASGGRFKQLSADSVVGLPYDTLNLNEGMFFQFTGTGFSVYFNLDRKADAVRICWENTTYPTPDGTSVSNVLNNGDCQTFDNQSLYIRNRAARTIAGLDAGNYAVVVQMLPDQGEPAPHPTTYLPITMQIDAVEVHNHTLPGNILNDTTTRYETSFTNRVADDRFVYIGTAWRSLVGTAARFQSGMNYDTVIGAGSGVLFRTANADTVVLYRDIRSTYSPIHMCATRESDNSRNCTIILNSGGTGYQQPISFPLLDNSPHVVTIVTMDALAFNLDAIEVRQSAPLTAGLYDENNPALVYSNSSDPMRPIYSHWRDIIVASYLDRGAMQSNAANAQVQFRFTGTGFSVFSLFDTLSGTNGIDGVRIDIDGTTDDYMDLPFSSYNTRLTYGSAFSVTGLLLDTYTVTIRETDPTRNRLTIDGVEIYNHTLPTMTPGIYDNEALSGSTPYVAYGPSNAAWTLRSTANYLNLTNRLTNRYGAHATFSVSGAGVVTLYHTGSTSTKVVICATNVATGDRFCSAPTSFVGRPSTSISLIIGSTDAEINLPAGAAPGNYVISVVNMAHLQNLILDAIGVHGTTLTEGIYQERHPLLETEFTGTWLPDPVVEATATDGFVRSTGTGDSGETLDFTFNGTGFSLVLVESTLTSGSYTLTIDGGAALTDVPVQPRPTSTAKKPIAITVVGLPAGNHTVVLTNNDSTKPLLVDRVDILGDLVTGRQIAADVTGNVENTDPRIIYLPFFSYMPVLTNLASGGSQQSGVMQGSAVYFELTGFNGNAVEYVRQTLSSHGQADVCTGALDTSSAGCTATLVANNVATPLPFGYQRSHSISPVATGNRWVMIRNNNGKIMTFDFARPTVAGEPLTAGYFEETHPTLRFFTEAGSVYTLLPSGDDGNFVDLPVTAASGGSVKLLSADAGSPGNGFNEGMLFQFTGTGFAVKFTLDAKADAVKICWTNSHTENVATVLGGTCETYDNQSAASRYQASRVIHTLAQTASDFTVVVQMLTDDGIPTPHIATALPISMQIDAVQVFNETLPGDVLDTLNTRYETSYVNRVTEDRFLYFGLGWRSFSGNAYSRYSGKNYDSIANVIGAGVTFRTTGANAIILYRDTRAGYAPLLVCAAPTSDLDDRLCTVVTNTMPVGNQQPARVFLNQIDSLAEHVVTITTLQFGTFNLDAIELIDSTTALGPGFYEDVHPGLNFSNPLPLEAGEFAWSDLFVATYSDRRLKQTNDDDATLTFSFTGATGFEIGSVIDRYGGEMEVCYDTEPSFADPVNCYVYQHESARISALVSRTVTGLATGTTYHVRVRNVEDGQSILTLPPGGPRPATYALARMRIDYVRILDEAMPPVVPAGLYNENAVDGAGAPYLQLAPAVRWGVFSGTVARLYSGMSYYSVVDNAKRASVLYAGPTATLRVTVPTGAGAAGSATVILYTGTAISTNTDQLLVCANAVDSDPVAPAGNCAVFNLKLTNQVVLNENILSALGADGTTVTLSFRALTPGGFKIDGFQVIDGTILTPGVYDDFLLSNGGLLDTGGSTVWTFNTKLAGSYNGTIASAKRLNQVTDNPTMTFEFDGTGFAIVTRLEATGGDMQICYTQTSTFDGTFDGGVGEFCDTVTTDGNTLIADWIAKNGNQPRLSVVAQYGFAYHGLENLVGDTYTVEVKFVDTTVTIYDRMVIDAVVIFDDASTGTPLTPGTVYDNTQAGLMLSPGNYWTQVTARFGPPRGPFNLTETTTTTVGATVQVYLDGNAMVLYQSATARGSRYIRLCLATPGLNEECSEFSQYSARATYFTPIVFYGFGTTDPHVVIIENRDPSRIVSIDAIRVLP